MVGFSREALHLRWVLVSRSEEPARTAFQLKSGLKIQRRCQLVSNPREVLDSRTAYGPSTTLQALEEANTDSLPYRWHARASVICHFLWWHGVGFRFANPALPTGLNRSADYRRGRKYRRAGPGAIGRIS